MAGSPSSPAFSPAAPPPARALAWPRIMQLGLAFLLGSLGLLLVQHAWQRTGTAGRPATPVEPAIYLIDLNRANRAELVQLPGVGESLAERILEYRRSRQAFASVDELESVDGVGPVLLERLRPRVYVQPDPGTLPSAGLNGTRSSRKNPPLHSIDLNRASREELMQLPGIGPIFAERIVKDRTERGPYREVIDITRVKGIKAKMLEKIRPYVRVGEEGGTLGESNRS